MVPFAPNEDIAGNGSETAEPDAARKTQSACRLLATHHHRSGTERARSGSPAVMGRLPFRPMTLRPRLSPGLPFAEPLPANWRDAFRRQAAAKCIDTSDVRLSPAAINPFSGASRADARGPVQVFCRTSCGRFPECQCLLMPQLVRTRPLRGCDRWLTGPVRWSNELSGLGGRGAKPNSPVSEKFTVVTPRVIRSEVSH